MSHWRQPQSEKKKRKPTVTTTYGQKNDKNKERGSKKSTHHIHPLTLLINFYRLTPSLPSSLSSAPAYCGYPGPGAGAPVRIFRTHSATFCHWGPSPTTVPSTCFGTMGMGQKNKREQPFLGQLVRVRWVGHFQTLQFELSFFSPQSPPPSLWISVWLNCGPGCGCGGKLGLGLRAAQGSALGVVAWACSFLRALLFAGNRGD